MKQGLILVDIQNDYFPNGSMELVQMEKAAKNAQSILENFRKNRMPIFHVQHLSMYPGATFFLPDTDGVKTHASVAPLEGEAIITKQTPNSFRDTELLAALNNAELK